MNKNELIVTRKDIIMFFIISLFFSIIAWNRALEISKTSELTERIIFLSFYFLPSILALLLNLIFKLTNIENEKFILFTKGMFSVFKTIYFLLICLITFFGLPILL